MLSGNSVNTGKLSSLLRPVQVKKMQMENKNQPEKRNIMPINYNIG